MIRAIASAGVAISVVVAVFLTRSESRGDGPSTKPSTANSGEKSPTPQTAVERALAEPTEFNFVDTPLADIAKSLSDRYKINVLLDAKALADAGIAPETKFSEQMKGVSLASALRHLLEPKDLAALETDDNVLSITTADVANIHTSTRLYDVSDLADPPVEFVAGPKSWSQLSQLVTSFVAPLSWDSNGGPGSLGFFDGRMLVSQTDEIHEEIADCLAQLRLARKVNSAATAGGTVPMVLPSDPGDARIEALLDSRQDFEFDNVRLGDVAKALEAKLGIPVRLDTKALTDAGVSDDAPMSLNMKHVRVRVGLRELLSPKDLDFLIDGELLLITTGDLEKAKTVTRLYPVKDLIGDGDPRTVSAAYASLTAAITATVAPQSWDANGGAGSIVSFPLCDVLVVSETQQIHQEVKNVLELLRAARKKIHQSRLTAACRKCESIA
ncbi:MAG TPA: DUF4974 domain-containing protein [Pirellulales bacterium]|jgi:hypothetical protein|nr:DUF4974 domain-containing protein [Pirellulales bacterium]